MLLRRQRLRVSRGSGKDQQRREKSGWGTYGYLDMSTRKATCISATAVPIRLYPRRQLYIPLEIENVLLGVPKSKISRGRHSGCGSCEAPLAIVVAADTRDPASDTVRRITQSLRAVLNRMQTPRWIVFVESLPRSVAGKLLRRILKE